jgi:hypothetical protein
VPPREIKSATIQKVHRVGALWLRIVGVLLIALGAVLFASPYVSYSAREHVRNTPLSVSAKRRLPFRESDRPRNRESKATTVAGQFVRAVSKGLRRLSGTERYAAIRKLASGGEVATVSSLFNDCIARSNI